MKTRAFDPETKQWRTDYVVMPDGSIHRSFKVDNGVEFMGFYEIAEQVNWKLSRFIGIKDKDGDEIYEHQIIDNGIRRYTMVYDAENFEFVLRHSLPGRSRHILIENTQYYKIIGNVFQNPELLEV